MAAADRAIAIRCRSAIADHLPPWRNSSRTVDDSHREPPPANVATDDDRLATFDEATLALLNDEAGRRLDGQHSEITQLDTKAGSLIAASVAVTGFLLSGRQTWLTMFAAVAHTGVFFLGLVSLAVRSWSQAPTPDGLLQIESASHQHAYDLVLRAKVSAFNENSENRRAKSDWVKICTWMLVVAFGLTVVAKLV